MAAKKKVEEELEETTDEVEETETSEEESESDEIESDSKSISFKVRSKNHKDGFTVRTFDEANHGKDFTKLAKEFNETNKDLILGIKK